MIKACILVFVSALLLPLSLFSQQPSPTLTNKDVLSMLKAGLAPEIVVAKIKSSSCEFDTSPTALKELKSAGVPDAVILAMVQAESEKAIRSAFVTCVNAKEVPIFASPGAGPEIAAPRCGEKIEVLVEKTNGWDKIRTQEGKVGYISMFFVSEKAQESSQTRVSAPASPSTALPPNTLRAVAWRAVPWVTTSYYQQPGRADTDCTGSGTWFGSIWQGNASCTTQYTPAQSVPLNWYHYTVYNLVETADSWLVIGCTRNWAFSKCSYLIPGDLFAFEYKKGQIIVKGQRAGKEKTQTLKFDIVSSQTKR